MSRELSVADQLYYDALEPETRAMVDRIIATRVEDETDAQLQDTFNMAFSDGHSAGYSDGKALILALLDTETRAVVELKPRPPLDLAAEPPSVPLPPPST